MPRTFPPPRQSQWTWNPPPPCSHKSQRQCMLTAVPCCCSCADRRPQDAAYPIYVDGKGIRMEGKRWTKYCRKCRDWCAAEDQTAEQARQAENQAQAQAQAAADSDMRDPRDVTAVEDRAAVRGALNQRQMRRQMLAQRQALAFGTREEAQADDYESPLAGMFTRAWTRFRDAEDLRRAQREHDRVGSENWFPEGWSVRSPDLDLWSSSSHDRIQPPSLMDSQATSNRGSRVESSRGGGGPVTADGRGLYDDDDEEDESEAQAETDINEQENVEGNENDPEANRILQETPPQSARTSITTPPIRNRPQPILGIDSLSSATQSQDTLTRTQSQLDTANLDTALALARIPDPWYITQIQESRRRFSTQPRPLTEPDPMDVTRPLPNPIDLQTTSSQRPAPRSEENLVVNIACKICLEQRITTLVEPCMHACMCQWCAEIYRESCRDERGRFVSELWKCPVCRRRVKGHKRFYLE